MKSLHRLAPMSNSKYFIPLGASCCKLRKRLVGFSSTGVLAGESIELKEASLDTFKLDEATSLDKKVPLDLAGDFSVLLGDFAALAGDFTALTLNLADLNWSR